MTFSIKKFLTFSCLLTGLTFGGVASAAQDYTWEEHKLKFALSDDMKEDSNDSTQFVAKGPGIYFRVIPWKDSSETAENIAKATLENLSYSDVEIAVSDAMDVESFKGYLIVGTGLSTTKENKGKKVQFAVLGFIDPDSDSNFSSLVSIWAGDSKAEDKAEQIIRSFSRM